MFYRFFIIHVLVSILICSEAQKAKLLTGPMIGSTTTHSSKIWIAYEGKANNIVALYDSFRREVKFPNGLDYIKNKKNQIAMTLDFTTLRPGTKYSILIKLGDKVVQDKLSVWTLSEDSVKDFSFIVGSCFLILPDALGKNYFPGRHKRILKPMINSDADFNLWLGDNCYYILGQWKSYERMFKRQLNMRIKNKLYAKYLSSRPNYAIWDDHDFGPNDCDKSFPLRDTSLKIFTHFWANESWGFDKMPGTYSSFTQYDATFFLTDDRYNRSERGDSVDGAILGKDQFDWLKSSLLKSKSTFKFIVTGSQVLNRHTEKECWMTEFPKHTNELLDFIKENQITGVIFLTGDRHLTHLIKDQENSFYPLYDFTCSPVLSFVSEEHEIEMNNPQVVPGTLVQKQHNYGKISISGDVGNRTCTMYDYDEFGNQLWKYEIKESELR